MNKKGLEKEQLVYLIITVLIIFFISTTGYAA